MVASENAVSAVDELNGLSRALSPERVVLLVEMAKALRRGVTCVVMPSSDIVTTAFERNFSGRLLLFHAMHDAPVTKKTFEYFFCGASRAAGRQAVQTRNAVHPGEDAIVEGQKFSLKTESGKSIKRQSLHISKLMEARTIRDCLTAQDFCALAQQRIVGHLAQYERIVTLRSFQPEPDIFEYDLVEIPRSVLLRISSLQPSDFSPRTDSGSSSATVLGDRGEPLFTLSLDGSVEKVTVRGLDVRACKTHARWRVILAL